jgi:hypothetical protein
MGLDLSIRMSICLGQEKKEIDSLQGFLWPLETNEGSFK